MQSLAQYVDSTLTIDDLPDLETRLDLPDGWSYEAIVIQDDLGNTYPSN